MTSMTTASRNHHSPDMFSSRNYFSSSSSSSPSAVSSQDQQQQQFSSQRPASADLQRRSGTDSPTYLIRGVPIRVDYGSKVVKAGRRRSNTLPSMPVTTPVDRFQQRTYEYVSPKPGTPAVNYSIQYNRPRSSTYSAGQSFPNSSSSSASPLSSTFVPRGILVRQPLSRQNSQDKTVQFQGPLVDDDKITTNKYPEEKYPTTTSSSLSSFSTPVKSIYSDMPAPIQNYEKDPPMIHVEDPLPIQEQRAFEQLAAEQPKPDPTPLPKPLRPFEDALHRELVNDEIRNAKPQMTYADVGVGFSDSPYTPIHVPPPPLSDPEQYRGEKRYRFAYPKVTVPPHETSLDRHLQQEEMKKIADMEGKRVADTIMYYWHELAAQQEDELH